MTLMRLLAPIVCAVLAAGCSAPSATQRQTASEIAQMAQLRRAYPAVVMGFDLRTPNTLIVSLDLQAYDEMDDDAIAAMKRAALARWRTAWSAAHPGERALLTVRFIDFIGRKVGEESVRI